MFVEGHEERPPLFRAPEERHVLSLTTHPAVQHAAPTGLMRDGGDIHRFLQTCRSSGAKNLHQCITELSSEKHIIWWGEKNSELASLTAR